MPSGYYINDDGCEDYHLDKDDVDEFWKDEDKFIDEHSDYIENPYSDE